MSNIATNLKKLREAKKLSQEKLSVAKEKIRRGIIITADTIVVLNKEIIGKPKNRKDAVNILKKLSGKTHKVYTGYSIYNSVTKKIITDYEKTSVTFRILTQNEIKEYVNTGSPMDKAGAYGIQEWIGMIGVTKIEGSYFNVMGMPTHRLYDELSRF